MSSAGDEKCNQSELVSDYAARALGPAETSAFEAHLASCPVCREQLAGVRALVDSLVGSPAGLLSPSTDLGARLARRVAEEGVAPVVAQPVREWTEPAWEVVGGGISCKVLSKDPETRRVSMLVRLAPGAEYPPHRHAGVEELFLLQGELWIDDRKLYPGDYNHAERGTADARVYSETGCACVLITSLDDELR